MVYIDMHRYVITIITIICYALISYQNPWILLRPFQTSPNRNQIQILPLAFNRMIGMNPNQSANPSPEPVKRDGTHSRNDDPKPNVDRNNRIPPSRPATGNSYTFVGQPSQTAGSTTPTPPGPNPYVSTVPVRESSTKNTIDSVKVLFGKWAKKSAEATKKGQEYAEDMWQHLKTGPSITDATVGRIAQGAKVLAEGGYDKIFETTFQTMPEERLLNSYACYLSTSAGPVMGLLYISTAKLAFCSDNPLPYKVGEEKKWSYYKVVMPLLQLKVVQPSRSKSNPVEKYIQVISVDDHEFWFMGFVNYDSAVKNLLGALDPHQYPLSIGTSKC